MSNIAEDTNALEMSDDEFLKVGPSAFDGPAAPVDDAEGANDTDDSQQEDDPVVNDKDDNKQDPVIDPVGDDKKVDPIKDAKEDPIDTSKKPETDELGDQQLADIGRQIMAEFKANGTTMKVKSVDDAIQLMQMGANYHKKMAGLKPSLKTLKLLDNHGLLDPEKLNYLIDLSQKKPEAITKLLKDSQIDPMDIDLKADDNYVATNRTVNDTDMVLDEVLESIKPSPQYDRTLTVIAEDWDAASRRAIGANPEIIRTINQHMESGIFDQVASAVAYERSLGKLVGVSEFDAYQRVGTYMHENNLFKLAAGSVQPNGRQNRQDPQSQNNTSQALNENEDDRKNRKRAASPSRQRIAPASKDSNYNPLEMSDEEFVKINKLHI